MEDFSEPGGCGRLPGVLDSDSESDRAHSPRGVDQDDQPAQDSDPAADPAADPADLAADLQTMEVEIYSYTRIYINIHPPLGSSHFLLNWKITDSLLSWRQQVVSDS